MHNRILPTLNNLSLIIITNQALCNDIAFRAPWIIILEIAEQSCVYLRATILNEYLLKSSLALLIRLQVAEILH